MQRSTPILWGLVIILLVLNLLLLDALNLARLTAIDTLSQVEKTLDGLANEVIVYNIEVNQAVPVSVDVPFNRTMEIPLNTVIPIDQVLTVPFQTPAGEVMLEVPVRTDVPINMVVPVDFNQTISVDTVVQLDTALPVEIDIAQTSLAGYLKQTQLEIARLRSRLGLRRRGLAGEETGNEALLDTASRADIAPGTPRDSQSQALPTGPQAGAPVSEPIAESDAPQVPQPSAPESTPWFDNATHQANLGPCTHPYWPLWLGTTWTYNSRNTSYTQAVEEIFDNEVLLSTRYGGRDIQFNLSCYPEGLGGAYLGDMRRITELGDLEFINPRGVFLPGPETMEEIGRPWRQELDVTGRVYAIQGESGVEGMVSRGRAVAVYTPVRFETVETPLGPRQALRVEQRLDVELDITFDLGGQTIPGTEIVNLSNIYWYARDMGLVKMHWQGGTIQQSTEIGQTPMDQRSTVPGLAEDQLVFICVTLGDQSVKCAGMDGFSQSDLTAPPESELSIPDFLLPDIVGSGDRAGTPQPGGGQPPGGAAGDDDGRSDLRAYVAAVENLNARLSEAAEGFWEAALEFRGGRLTLDEFQSEFLEFAAEVSAVIQEVNRLSPPPEAAAVQQRLTNGLAKCDQAIGLMDNWFDTPNSDTKEAAALLVAECGEEVMAAVDELVALAGD